MKKKVILEASKLVVGNLFEIDTTENGFDDDEQVECTICAETIKDYVPRQAYPNQKLL